MTQDNLEPSPRIQSRNGVRRGSVVQHDRPIVVSDRAIAERAYEKFLARGGGHGLDREDWMEARRELIAEESDR